jgi:hypothetical protein
MIIQRISGASAEPQSESEGKANGQTSGLYHDNPFFMDK